MREFRGLAKEPIEDIKVFFDEQNMTMIEAEISGPSELSFVMKLYCSHIFPAGTPYQNGVFRCKLVFGADFPAAPPKGEKCFRLAFAFFALRKH